MIRELILRYPQAYKYFQICYGMSKLRRILLTEYIAPEKGDKILDIGCGTADILDNFQTGIEYTGIDINERYLAYDKKHYVNRPQTAFINADVKAFLEKTDLKYDFILFLGSSQNFDDAMLEFCYGKCYEILNKGGKLVIVDGVYTEDTNAIERFLMKNNRGPHIRVLEGWKDLVSRCFTNVSYSVRKDLEHFPNCQVIMVATK